MDSKHAIDGFLDAVRRRLRRRTAARALLLAAAAILATALLAPLAATALSPEWGLRIGKICIVVGLIILTSTIYLGFVRPRRQWRPNRHVARYVGKRETSVASDLLSAIELTREPSENARARFSPKLVEALLDQVATAADKLRPVLLVPWRKLRASATLCGVAALFAAIALVVAPGRLASGWHRLVIAPAPGPFGGAQLSDTPLVGDIDITLDYPLYAKRPSRTLHSTSGDFRTMPGTTVTISTTALDSRSISAANIVFGSGGDNDDPIKMEIAGRSLSASFTVTHAEAYRFLIESPQGRHTEAAPHLIEMEADLAPEVELYTPADELDVSSLKRIELAYIAEDDYGIAKIELVTTSGAAASSKPHRKVIPLPELGRRRAQSKFLWDLSEVPIEPGERVGYHIEVTDNDAVLGPNIGKSKVFYLRVYSPRERHEALVMRQRELFEKLLANLGARLVVPAEDVRAHQVIQRDTAEAVVEIGSVVAALGDDTLAPGELVSVLTEMRTRLDKLSRAEAKLLDRLAKKQAQGASSKPIAARLASSDKTMVAELENDVLALADWIDRQRLENVLAITDEIKTHQDRLRELLDEYQRTGDPKVREEIERELRTLSAKLAELAASRGQMPADVLDQFLNSEAMQGENATDCLAQVRELLDAGDTKGAQVAMEECAKLLDDSAAALEEALSELRGDRFSEPERKLNELMDEIADLAHDQQAIADVADGVWERYAQRADEMMRDQAKETRRKLAKTIDKLRKRLDKVDEDGLTPFSKEELEVVNKRLDDLDEMLADGDIAEALAMAKQARDSLDTIATELESVLDEYPRAPWIDSTKAAQRDIKRAQPLARKVVEELEALTPSPREIMSKPDRRRLDRLRRRQQAVRERTRRLAKKATQQSSELPGGAGKELARGADEAGEQMGRAEKRMRAQDPSAARQEARSAAETLRRTKQDAQGAARRQQRAGRGWHEPVRIPGADDYKPPEKFREDILEAMKKDTAPRGFTELVRRYYEELIR